MDADTRARWRVPAGAAIVLVLAALAVTVVIGMVRTASAPTDGLVVDAHPAQPSLREIYVHVAGAVREPGLYRLGAGSRVVDAVAAAGGFSRRADPAGVNLAREVSDGEQLHVPRRGEADESPSTSGPASGSSADGRIDINTADPAALETLPRIGPTLAARIIEWREQNGRFTSVDDLLAVPGIGEKLLEGLRDAVRV